MTNTGLDIQILHFVCEREKRYVLPIYHYDEKNHKEEHVKNNIADHHN